MDQTPARRWLRLLQLLASLAVIAVLARDLDRAAISSTLARSSAFWLVAALLSKALGLCVHEVRLWLCLPEPRPPFFKVFALGFIAGMMNLVLPARGGDLLAIALLHRECGVRTSAATAAVGLVAFLEAAVFGVFLCGVLVVGAARWVSVIGVEAQREAVYLVGGATLLGLLGVLALALIGRLDVLRGVASRGPLRWIRATAHDAGAVMGTPLAVLLHLALAALGVACTLGGFALALPAVGLDLPLPLLAAAGVLALSSVAAVALPPTFAAGPAAVSVAVLAAFGVSRADALAYSVAYWLVAHLPAVAVGLPFLWMHRHSGPIQAEAPAQFIAEERPKE